MQSEIIFRSIIFGLFFQNVFTGVVSESKSGDALKDNVNRDLCYLWRTNHYPFWIGPIYKSQLKKEADKFFKKNGKSIPAAEIREKCKIFPNNILDPEGNHVHYEICYYAKYGFWSSQSHTEHEAKERLKLFNKFVVVGGKRISQQNAKILCSNYSSMKCPLCTKDKEQVCYYAAEGSWKNDKQPKKKRQNNFFYNGESLINWQEIWNKCEKNFKNKTFSLESVHYPPCSNTVPSTKTTTYISSVSQSPPDTPPSETLPPDTPPPVDTPSPNIPTHDNFTNCLLTSVPPTPEIPPPKTPPPETHPPETPPPETPPPETPPPETSSPKTSSEISPPNTIPNQDNFKDKSIIEPILDDILPPWYYPNKPILDLRKNLRRTRLKPLTTGITLLTTTEKTSTTNTPPTSTKSTTLTWTTKPIPFTTYADCTITTSEPTITKLNTTIIVTPPTVITSTTDIITVEGPVCPTCSQNKHGCQCNETHLHLHLNTDKNDSILILKEVLKTLKLFNCEKD